MATVVKYEKDSAFTRTAAAAILAGQLVGLNSFGNVVLADADASTPIPAVGVALHDADSGALVGVCYNATVRNIGALMTPGSLLYASGTAGAITATAPSTATNIVQPVGFAVNATDAVLNVTPNWSVVQASGPTTRVPN